MPKIRITLKVSAEDGRSESLGSTFIVHAGTVLDVYQKIREPILAMPPAPKEIADHNKPKDPTDA